MSRNQRPGRVWHGVLVFSSANRIARAVAVLDAFWALDRSYRDHVVTLIEEDALRHDPRHTHAWDAARRRVQGEELAAGRGEPLGHGSAVMFVLAGGLDPCPDGGSGPIGGDSAEIALAALWRYLVATWGGGEQEAALAQEHWAGDWNEMRALVARLVI